jgi:ABC-type uncharacterized transport system involved in gliding motility auxiliary subunit
MSKTPFMLFLRYSIIHALRRPVFFVTAILYNAACSLYYLIGTGFFSGSGSTDLRLFFAAIPYISILLIPVISSESDDSAFTDTFPLSSLEHILASFLTSIVQFCIMSISLLLLPVCICMFGDMDPGQIFTGFFLILIYETCAISFCLLANSFLNQLVAFIISAVFIALTNFLQITVSFRELSFSYHFDAASKGIFDTRDIFFYGCLTFFFLLSCVCIQEKKKGRAFLKKDKKKLILLFIIIVFSFLNSTRYYWRADFTRDKQFSISKYGKHLLSQIDEPLKITYFRSPALVKLYPQVRDIYEYLDDYASENKNISLKMFDPDKEKVSGLLNNYGIQSQQIQTGGINKTDYLNVYSAIVVEYSGQTQIIPFIISTNTLEYDLDRSVDVLLTGKKMCAAVICGNGKNTGNDYTYIIPWLMSRGISCTEIDLQGLPDEISKIDTNTVLLVFGSSELNGEAATAIESFILRGGKAFFAVSPYIADIAGDWTIKKPKNDTLLDMLASYGFGFTPEIAADISCARITMTSDTDDQGKPSDSTHSEQINYPFWISILPQKESRQGMTLFWPTPITIENDCIKPLLVSSTSSWTIDEDDSNQSKLFETNPFVVQNMPVDSNRKQLVLGAYLNGKIKGHFIPQESANTRIAVLGDQYFSDSLMMEYAGGSSGDYRNLDFLTHMILKLNDEQGLESLQNKNASSVSLYKISDLVTFKSVMIKTYVILYAVMPLLYIVAYILSVLQRRKQNKQFLRRFDSEK